MKTATQRALIWVHYHFPALRRSVASSCPDHAVVYLYFLLESATCPGSGSFFGVLRALQTEVLSLPALAAASGREFAV